MALNSFSPFMSMPSGMGYSGADPVRLPYQQPSGAATPPLSGRNAQMMARYLPGSGTGVDPNFSPTTTGQRGGWQNMIPQRLQGLFQQFQGANPGMTNYDQYRQATGYASRAPVNPAPIATAMQGQMNSMGMAIGGGGLPSWATGASPGIAPGFNPAPYQAPDAPDGGRSGYLGALTNYGNQGAAGPAFAGGQGIGSMIGGQSNAGAPVVNALMRNRTTPTSTY